MKFTSIKKLIPALLLSLVLLVSCKDYNDLDLEEVDSGNADFSTYVAVGNSLTAGFQNNALYRSGQEYSFPKLIARQLRSEESFDQPLISDPGIGGRIELTSLDPIGTTTANRRGVPINQSQKPFRNMGIPGSILVDYLNPNNQGQLKERATQPGNPAFNPFYSFVLPDGELAKEAPNIHNIVAAQNPTFITFWLGNNDVLGFVTSGGQGQPITDPATFTQLYEASTQALQATGASVIVYNIPDVTSIPYVFLLRSQLEQQGVIRFNENTQSYQLQVAADTYRDIYINVDGEAEVMREADFPTLQAQAYFAQVQDGEVTPPIDLNGDGTPEGSIPDNLVLDGPRGGAPGSSELEQAAAAVAQYNAAIEAAASSAGFGLVDINSVFDSTIQNFQANGGGYDTGDLVLQPVPGSLFSFDGIHPGNQGSAVIANETIRVINETFGSSIPEIDVSDIPEGLPIN